MPRISQFWICFAVLVVITVIRMVGLRYSVVDLFIDESQYWAWSRELAFGYFSKPPLLAWVIAGAGVVCGNGEACVRAASPLFYFGTGLLGYAIARELYGQRAAFWAAIAIISAPGVAFSSRIISTDVPLLFFWALALLAYVKLLRGAGLRWAIVLGVAFGCGLLAKYAMIYFLLGVAIISIVDRNAGRLLLRKEPWLALAIGGLLIAPNVIWNASHQFDTFHHTSGLVSTDRLGFKPGRGLEFLGAQFAVFGPIVFGGFLVILARWRGSAHKQEDRWMIAFAIPPLAIITTLAFVHGAYGNWAAPAFISAAVVVSAVLVRKERWGWLAANAVIAIFVQTALLFGDASADKITVSVLGWRDDPYRRSMGWHELAEVSGRIARREGTWAIVGNNRNDVASLTYYLRDSELRTLIWPQGNDAENYFTRSVSLTGNEGGSLLMVTPCPNAARLERFYQTVTPVGAFDSRSGPTTSRKYFVFKLSGSRGAVSPLGVCG